MPAESLARHRFVADELPSRQGEAATDADSPAAVEVDFEAAKQEAYEAGRQAGRAELPWREAERVEQAAASLERAAERLDWLGEHYLLANRQATVELALAIAERILGRRPQADAEALAAVLAQALGTLDASKPVTVRVRPEELAAIESGLRERVEALERVHFEADPRVPAGEARLENPDARITTRLDEVVGQVREALGDAFSGGDIES